MEFLKHSIDLFLHIDKYLGQVIQQYGVWTHVILLAIVFCETGLVITPFLPGDSLLFAAGAFAAIPQSELDIRLLIVMLTAAAIVGDAVNYHIGKYIGPRAFSMNTRFLKREYLTRTQRFFEKYGGKAIVFARFVPIVRTFAPFLAGVGTMSYARFAIYNVTGGILWVCSFCGAGYFFGEMPIVKKKNFTLVIIAIIIISVLPAVVEYIKARRETVLSEAS